MSSQWRSHSSIARIINYHVFKFMVHLSAHSALREELAVLRNKNKERYAEWFKLTTRIVKLEGKKWTNAQLIPSPVSKNNNIISPIIQASPSSSSLLSSPSSSSLLSSSKINLSSASLFGGVSRINLYLCSISSGDFPWIQNSPRLLINSLFLRSVPLFRHLSYFT